MENSALSSQTERAPQVTYQDKKKSKSRRRAPKAAESDSDSNTESKPPNADPSSPNKSAKGPKKVEVPLPGPSPKRVRRDSEEGEMPIVEKSMHVRAAPSVTSLKQVVKKVQETPVAAKKPRSTVSSTRKPRSHSRSESVADDDDDDASIAESTVSTGKVRRNETERLEYFQNQPECGKIEPHQAHCLRCNKDVNLGRRQKYCVRPWETHRTRCDQRPAFIPPTTVDNTEASTPARVPQSPSLSLSLSSKPTPARRLSEQERKEFLDSEKQIETVEKHRVLCRKCQNWVDLSKAHPFVTGNWMRHKVRCPDAIPSNRVAAAKRRLSVANDPQAKVIDAENVICKYCNSSIKLEGEGDSVAAKWDEHKSLCTETAPISQVDAISSTHTQSTRPPSSASTNETVVADVGSSQASKSNPGLKRLRDDSELIPEEDDHKNIRPRTESYQQPQMDPPNSLLGWFMMPFHSFVRGFKESLKDNS